MDFTMFTFKELFYYQVQYKRFTKGSLAFEIVLAFWVLKT